MARRYEGYERACAKPTSDPRQRIPIPRARKWVPRRQTCLQQSLPTAIFAGDDAADVGVYKPLGSWPEHSEDLSVAGFNDTPEAAALHPH